MDQESELTQRINALEQKIEKNHKQSLIAVSTVAAGIFAAALAFALGWHVRSAALGCIVAAAVTAGASWDPTKIFQKVSGGWR
jgi:hypothetical protein